MTASIGSLRLTVRTSPHTRDRAAALARDVRSVLPDALGSAAAAAASGDAGVVLVPRMHLSLSARLGRVRSRDIARTLAEACFDAALKRSAHVASVADEGGTAQQIVESLRAGASVRCDSRAQAAAAWLIALILDEPGMLRSFAPYADLQYRSSGAAFAQICARAGDARGVIGALGRRWSLVFASRCSESDARAVLSAWTDAEDPGAATWAFFGVRLSDGSGDAHARARRVLSAAIDGSFERRVGSPAAARALLAVSPTARRVPDVAPGAPMESNLTGMWLLWTRLGPYLSGAGDVEARAIALALAWRLGGTSAAEDPALAVLCTAGESLGDLQAALPPTVNLARLTVAVVRDFARTLRHFERARAGYVLRAILSGPGTVRRRPGGWEATLPRSPLRVVLERASHMGALEVPWQAPRLTLVRDDD